MKESKEKHDFLRVQPDMSEVFHYSFCYIGALAGKNFLQATKHSYRDAVSIAQGFITIL
jgi:hypothetical protein